MITSNNTFNSADNYQRFDDDANPNYGQDGYGSSPSELFYLRIFLMEISVHYIALINRTAQSLRTGS